MKRTDSILVNRKIFILFAVCLAFLTGCKTAPVVTENKVHASLLLDDEAAMYIHVPSKGNDAFLKQFVLGFNLGINEKDAELLIGKIDDVYASFGSKMDKKRFQIACESKIPSQAGSLLKKNGFTEKSLEAKRLNISGLYKYYEGKNLSIAFPASYLTAISTSVTPMLEEFTVQKVLNGIVKTEEPYREDWIESDLYKWITNDDSKIRFYLVRPQSFLTNLLGLDVSSKTFKLNYAKGSFEKLDDKQYELSLELEFQDERFVKPAVALLSLSFGLTDYSISQDENNKKHVVLSGVKINGQQLIKMFGK